jgi:AcrR family transcriptional regulator
MAQLKRDDWLQHGLQALAEGGIDTLTIDALCQQLGVTKGSFYHHFGNHRAYLTAILEYWENEYTSRFINESQTGSTVEEQLKRLNDMVVASYGHYEVNIRAWAQSDPLAREFQERVDQRRLAYLYNLYKQWLNDDNRAKAMAHLVYTTLIGSSHLVPPLAQTEFEEMTDLLALLIQTLNSEGKK